MDQLIKLGDVFIDAVTYPKRVSQRLVLAAHEHGPKRLAKALEEKQPWTVAEGRTVEEKLLDLECRRLIPPEVLEKLDILVPGSAESIKAVTKNLLEGSTTQNERMWWSGAAMGFATALLVGGEKKLEVLGYPHATEAIIALQGFLTVLSTAIRWKAVRPMHSVNSHFPTVVGRDLERVLSTYGQLSIENASINFQALAKAIADGYLAEATERRFTKYIEGFGYGLGAGYLVLLKPAEAAIFLGATLGLSKGFDKVYPFLIGKSLKELGDILTAVRNEINFSEAIARLKKELLSTEYGERVSAIDGRRREEADRKNTLHSLYVNLLPIIISTATRALAPDTPFALHMFSFMRVISEILTKYEQIASRTALIRSGESALATLKKAVNEALANASRWEQVIGQRFKRIETDNGLTYCLPQSFLIGEIKVKGEKGVKTKELKLTGDDLSLDPGDVILVVGENYSGKTTFLRSLELLSAERAHVHLVPGEDPEYNLKDALLSLVMNYSTELGKFSQDDVFSLIKANNLEEIVKNPIVQRFIEEANQVLKVVGNGFWEVEFFDPKRKLSGAQQLIMNTLLAFLRKPPEGERMIILVDDPMGVLDNRHKWGWINLINFCNNFFYLVEERPTLLCAANNVTELDLGVYGINENWRGINNVWGVIDVKRRKVSKMPTLLSEYFMYAVRVKLKKYLSPSAFDLPVGFLEGSNLLSEYRKCICFEGSGEKKTLVLDFNPIFTSFAAYWIRKLFDNAPIGKYDWMPVINCFRENLLALVYPFYTVLQFKRDFNPKIKIRLLDENIEEVLSIMMSEIDPRHEYISLYKVVANCLVAEMVRRKLISPKFDRDGREQLDRAICRRNHWQEGRFAQLLSELCSSAVASFQKGIYYT